MQKLFKSIFLLSLISTLHSCIGYSPNVIFTYLKDSKDVNCINLPENVELYFDSETIPFNYEKIGLVEVQSDGYMNEKEILEKLKNSAKTKCCDAIIGIKKNYITRDSGFLLSNEPMKEYKTISYNGIAVKKIL